MRSKRIAQLRRNVGFLAMAVVLGIAVSGSGTGLSALPPAGAVVSASTVGPTFTVGRPATPTSGDVLIASIDARLPSTAAIRPPTGWALIRRARSTPGYS